MEESLIRELTRFQDVLVHFVPESLWHEWVEANEKIIEYLENKENN